MLNMNITNSAIYKDLLSHKLFRSANAKIIKSKPFQLGLKMIYRHTRIREDMIVT